MRFKGKQIYVVVDDLIYSFSIFCFLQKQDIKRGNQSPGYTLRFRSVA